MKKEISAFLDGLHYITYEDHPIKRDPYFKVKMTLPDGQIIESNETFLYKWFKEESFISEIKQEMLMNMVDENIFIDCPHLHYTYDELKDIFYNYIECMNKIDRFIKEDECCDAPRITYSKDLNRFPAVNTCIVHRNPKISEEHFTDVVKQYWYNHGVIDGTRDKYAAFKKNPKEDE